METYYPQKIEKKWTGIWESNKKNKAEDFSKKPKFYNLNEFPYPSGSGLHVGHCMGWTASDVYTRMKRMLGYNVMFPVGWDAFGLPTENYAIKSGRKPAEVTKENTDMFRKQMKSLAYSVDWDREVNTTDPNYYRWTQWIFLQFYKHGYVDGKLIEVSDDDKTTPRMAYQAEMPINWCPSCKIGLANEEVIDGKCERCGAQAEKRMQKQWMLRITAYADRLIKDLDKVEYLDKIKNQQINWIGRSEGSEIDFSVKDTDLKIKVFTTRADTLFGCTYVVLSPEHSLINEFSSSISNPKALDEYIKKAKQKSDLERTELAKEKTGVKLEGIKAINPINNQPIDIWVADYVLASYGTGAVMAVPAHDERDWEFAKKYNIEIKQTIAPLYSTDAGPDAVREGKDSPRRRMVTVILKHWKEDKIFVLNWEKFNWHSFILGGVEEGESPEDAAIREAIEESGYKNVKSVKKIGFETHSYFYAAHKGVNRYSMSDCFVAQLSDGEYSKPEIEHTKNHTGFWMDTKEVKGFINLDNNCYYWSVYQDGERAFTNYGVMINSGEFDYLKSEEGKKKVSQKLVEAGNGNFAVNYKLRDWVFSRQHYWGEPIPIIHCEKCGMVPVPENELPLKLPEVENYEPTDTGESPLAKIDDWVNTACPKCDGKATRETDTMPNWAGSSWYYLAYAINQNNAIDNYKSSENIFVKDRERLDYWMPVDLYNGGMEHTTLHLLYSRFWHKFLYDLNLVPGIEPYQKRIVHGIILGTDGQKMSKSRGNVITPDDIVKEYGADSMRCYIMFIGPYDQESAWSTAGLQGVHRFLNRVWKNSFKVEKNSNISKVINKYILSISDDVENFRLNTYIAKLMEINNIFDKQDKISSNDYNTFLKLLFPAAPFIANELWQKTGNKGFIDDETWPNADEKTLKESKVNIAVQINGKVRGLINIKTDEIEENVIEKLKQEPEINKWLLNKKIAKTIYRPGKIISLVVS